MKTDTDDSLLRHTLACAVPLWINELKFKSPDYVQKRASICGQVVAEKGDIILYRSKRKGESAKAFNRLAEGMACLALIAKGGVTMYGLTFDAEFYNED